LPLPARLDNLPSAGTSLLDYKRGVTVHDLMEVRRMEEKRVGKEKKKIK
jgi:hypothetical protein